MMKIKKDTASQGTRTSGKVSKNVKGVATYKR